MKNTRKPHIKTAFGGGVNNLYQAAKRLQLIFFDILSKIKSNNLG